MKFKVALGTILLLFVVIFTLQNSEVVSIKFLFWSFELSRALMIFLVLAAGILIGAFLSNLPRIFNKGKDLSR